MPRVRAAPIGLSADSPGIPKNGGPLRRDARGPSSELCFLGVETVNDLQNQIVDIEAEARELHKNDRRLNWLRWEQLTKSCQDEFRLDAQKEPDAPQGTK